MAIAISPPFDSLPCITQISINNMVTREFLNRQCIVLQFRNTLSDLESHLDPESLQRANVYLQNDYQQLAGVDMTRLDITRAGIQVTENAADCERKHTSIYDFSPVLLNQQGDKAVVFLYQRGHAEQRAAYFLKKIGEIWFLEIKEMM
ncbi:hypothetical protein [Flavilitoribacter nigricans]|uniref:Uncharacterized protein n=1 Tax=Flavilitoribacter nigricans (strain ATCC 23147 / DSM 23189 / NBRC 102662 / NCIMB 1420 / SS-2) TaxID=1122177 RepID=A0A2D0NET6_FLAN2|nr:hypothetical protein [Flavilitoribacter nigricans]PHN06918.1 hypothetical protein CRP01_08865 [Flavilitoribacter nigricans DSM 23189 = NBRC 102662]